MGGPAAALVAAVMRPLMPGGVPHPPASFPKLAALLEWLQGFRCMRKGGTVKLQMHHMCSAPLDCQQLLLIPVLGLVMALGLLSYAHICNMPIACVGSVVQACGPVNKHDPTNQMG